MIDEATQEDLNRLLIVFQTERLMLVYELRPEAGLMAFIRGFNEPPLTVFLADAGHGAASPVKSVSAEETYPWTRFVNLSGYKEELVDWPAVERWRLVWRRLANSAELPLASAGCTSRRKCGVRVPASSACVLECKSLANNEAIFRGDVSCWRECA